MNNTYAPRHDTSLPTQPSCTTALLALGPQRETHRLGSFPSLIPTVLCCLGAERLPWQVLEAAALVELLRVGAAALVHAHHILIASQRGRLDAAGLHGGHADQHTSCGAIGSFSMLPHL